MLSRLFKKKRKTAPRKKMTEEKSPSQKARKSTTKLLTAEGWKRLMMRKTGKGKKT